MVWGRNLPAGGVFVGLATQAMTGKVRTLVAALGGGFWTWWFWLGVAGWADCANVAQTVGQSQFRHSCRAGGVWGQSVGVLMLRFFILYAGQLTVA